MSGPLAVGGGGSGFAAAKVAQQPNVVFAGPAALPAALPAFRALVEADIPALSAYALTGHGHTRTWPLLAPATSADNTLTLADAGTNTAVSPLTLVHDSSNAALANFGVALTFRGRTSLTTIHDMARIRAVWVDPTDASRTSKLVLSTYNVAAEVDAVTITHEGNVGIGTVAPWAKLEVWGEAAHPALFRVRGDALNWVGTIFDWAMTDGSNAFGLSISGYNQSSNKIIRLSFSGSLSGIQVEAGADDVMKFFNRIKFGGGISSELHNNLVILLNQHTNGGANKAIKFQTFQNGIQTAMIIEETNRVGIGTNISNPASRLHVLESDAATNSVTNVLTLGHNTSGTPAAGFGIGIPLQLESSTTENRDAALISARWLVATDASRMSQYDVDVYEIATARRAIHARAVTGGAQVAINQPTPTSTLDVNGDVEIASTGAVYLGDPTTDGSWRIMRSGNNLVFERRETGAWVGKGSFAA